MPLVPHVSSGQIVASTWGNLVADAVVMRFTTAAQRSSQLTAPILNQLTLRDDAPGLVEFWNGTIWRPLAGTPVAKGYFGLPDGNRTAAGLFDVLVFTIAAFPYPVTMVANVSMQGGFGSALHTYTWDVVPYSTGTPINALGPIQAGANAYAMVSVSYSWTVAANADPTWKIRANPSSAAAGNAFHTGGHATWIAYAS